MWSWRAVWVHLRLMKLEKFNWISGWLDGWLETIEREREAILSALLSLVRSEVGEHFQVLRPSIDQQLLYSDSIVYSLARSMAQCTAKPLQCSQFLLARGNRVSPCQPDWLACLLIFDLVNQSDLLWGFTISNRTFLLSSSSFFRFSANFFSYQLDQTYRPGMRNSEINLFSRYFFAPSRQYR